MGEEYRSISSSLCNLLHSPVTSSLLGSNILLNTLFSNTLSLRSSLNVSDQVSHTYIDALISQIYFGMKLYMFRTVPLSIMRSYSLYSDDEQRNCPKHVDLMEAIPLCNSNLI
jgi:hypothetical protein